MNTTKNTVPLNVPGSFAPSGFFSKLKARAAKPVQSAYRKPHEAATPAQTARLCEVLGRGMASNLRF
jgi:hypothetical protein